jgi:hypothetical protein
VVVAKGFANTINRTNVDQATKAIIGDAKVSAPSFASPSALTTAAAATPVVAPAAVVNTVYTGTLYTPVITPAQLVGKSRQTLESLYKDMADAISLNAQQIKAAEERQAFYNSIGDADGAARAVSRIPEYRAEIAQAQANQQTIINALNQLGPNN